MLKQMLPVVAGLVAGGVLYFAVAEDKVARKVHRTKAPLLLYSNAANPAPMMLPTGTAMYYDTSFDEGFSRYLVYINSNAAVDLSMAPFGTIDPLDARPVGKEALLRAVQEHPLTRQDLENILQSNRLNKEDVKEVLSRFVDAEK